MRLCFLDAIFVHNSVPQCKPTRCLRGRIHKMQRTNPPRAKRQFLWPTSLPTRATVSVLASAGRTGEDLLWGTATCADSASSPLRFSVARPCTVTPAVAQGIQHATGGTCLLHATFCINVERRNCGRHAEGVLRGAEHCPPAILAGSDRSWLPGLRGLRRQCNPVVPVSRDELQLV
jgi:hypothetical protein